MAAPSRACGTLLVDDHSPARRRGKGEEMSKKGGNKDKKASKPPMANKGPKKK